MRWQRPGQRLIEPDAFIPLAEETGLIFLIGRWALEEACSKARNWHQSAVSGNRPFVSVNLSARQFEQPDLLRQVRSALSASGLAPSFLQLEITETAIIKNPQAAIATLRALKKLGVVIAIDDFGAGYSSLSYLQQLPVDRLKVDRTFTRSLHPGDEGASVVKAIIEMAHALGIRVTAEGIETARQLNILRELGCDCAQGFYLSHPVPAHELRDI
jgi:EAL domain-containing protein (putative c-di-GMP-specific phosphodiesterase class I)